MMAETSNLEEQVSISRLTWRYNTNLSRSLKFFGLSQMVAQQEAQSYLLG